MPIYEIEVQKTSRTFIYVEADDASDAREAAEELAWNANDFDVLDEDFIIDEIALEDMREGQQYWSGGESGDWVSV